MITFFKIMFSLLFASVAFGQAVDYKRSLKRAQYLLNASTPTDRDFRDYSGDHDEYRSAVRNFVESEQFYPVLMRYHQRLFGVGLPDEYMEELIKDEIDNRVNKFARIECARRYENNGENRYKCYWSSEEGQSACAESAEQPVSVFWYPEIVAWVCPSIVRSCGNDLSRCFIEYWNEDEARNSELGTTETFDSRFAVIKSLGQQSAGLATSVVMENFSYKTILKPGVTAIDGAIAHFYKQTHHFKIDDLNLPPELISLVDSVNLTDTRFRLVNTGETYETAGVISTFGWLRRFSKNRTRANELYERLLCRKFTSELPLVFPQDPGNLREREGCSGCHATLDPLADFFRAWGEGGELYLGGEGSDEPTYFNSQEGVSLADLSRIISDDQAFATCQVQNVWEWLIGRKFYFSEEELRTKLSEYFINSNYSFKELVFAIATHPVFMSAARDDSVVTDPLEEPPLGQIAGNTDRECTDVIDYTADIAPKISLCTGCHNGSSGSRQDLSTEGQWETWGSQSVNMMSSGTMPPGQFGPEVDELKEAVRCWLEQNP